MDTISKYVVLLCLICCFLLTACDNANSPNSEIIHIRGASWAFNISSSYAIFGSYSESELKPEVILPVSDGDLLYLINPDDQEIYYRYSRKDGIDLVLSFDTLNANTGCLNGQLRFLELSANRDSWELFEQLTDPQRKQLSTLLISESLNAQMLSTLKQYESSLKGTGLMLEGNHDTQVLGELLSICRPEWFMAEGPLHLPDEENCLALSHVELLWIQGASQPGLALFPFCVNLESLILSEWEPGMQELLSLSKLRSLHTLTLAECDLISLSHIEFPPSLHRLQLIDCDTLSDISGIQSLGKLKGISFSGCPQIQEVGQLGNLTSLKWLGFPENVSQAEFESILSKQDELEAIELIGCLGIENISPLKNLPELNILIVDMEEEKLSALEALKDLDLLILPSTLFDEDPKWIDQLKAKLPNTQVVPGSGLCLGSGWILLLLPLVLLSRYLFRQDKSFRSH